MISRYSFASPNLPRALLATGCFAASWLHSMIGCLQGSSARGGAVRRGARKPAYLTAQSDFPKMSISYTERILLLLQFFPFVWDAFIEHPKPYRCLVRETLKMQVSLYPANSPTCQNGDTAIFSHQQTLKSQPVAMTILFWLCRRTSARKRLWCSL